MYIYIQWVRSAFHRLPTIGREWAALWVDFHSTYQLILRAYLASSSCRRFSPRSGWGRVSQGTHDLFLFCVIRRVYRYRGRRPQAGTLSYGSVSKFSIAHSVSAYMKGEQNSL